MVIGCGGENGSAIAVDKQTPRSIASGESTTLLAKYDLELSQLVVSVSENTIHIHPNECFHYPWQSQLNLSSLYIILQISNTTGHLILTGCRSPQELLPDAPQNSPGCSCPALYEKASKRF